jgi:alcohol dehydrogenase (cytochrome c)/quinohemoprotein ethanol dehydrogenase
MRIVLIVLGVAVLAACGHPAGTQRLTGQRIVAADAEPQNWLSHGRNYQETRYSPLRQIDTGNVRQLGLAWFYDLDTHRGQEATPLVVDGVIYTTSAWSKVQAFDAVSGRLLWQFDPRVPGAAAVKACCDVVNRGAAYWNGKVYVGTIDGRLIALDARSGQPLWSTMTVDESQDYTITGAPRVVKGRVIIGNGGAGFGVRGYLSAYDADTGRLSRRFYTVPGQPGHADGAASDAILATASDSWSPQSWKDGGGGGGTVWDSLAYDPELDLLYIGVGNGSYWARALRSPKRSGNNDNLFIGSIVALRPETGAYVWHYQETPGDQWNYASTQHMILADLNFEGRQRRLLLHAPKNGFFYVLDRATGQLLSARPYAKVTWARGIDLASGRPIVNPEADYSRTGKVWAGMPGSGGAHNWQPMAYSPQTGYVYIPVMEAGTAYLLDPHFKRLPKGINTGIDLAAITLPDDPQQLAAMRAANQGFLIAWDPLAQREVWRVRQPGSWNGGVLATAGHLVFAGDEAGKLNAYDAGSGARLWSFDAQSPVMAPPVSWSKDGRQYLTVLAGWGGAAAMDSGAFHGSEAGPPVNRSRVLTFRLSAAAQLPAALPPEPLPPLNPPQQFADAATVAAGRELFHRSCSACHGFGAIGGGIVPDLRYSATLDDPMAWSHIVADGTLSAGGMVGFSENFTAQQIDAIRAYLIDRAQLAAEH